MEKLTRYTNFKTLKSSAKAGDSALNKKMAQFEELMSLLKREVEKCCNSENS